MTNDSEDAKHKYQREDLIWEAVRRNELYKKDYYQLLWEKCIEIVKCEKYTILCDQIGCNMSLFYNYDKYFNEINRALESFKWQKLFYFNKYVGWKMLWLFNPMMDIDEIKVAIASEELKEKDHPYHHFYQQKRYPVIQFKVPKSMFNPKKIIPNHYFSEDDDDRSILCIKKDVLKDRLIISIDPMADNTQIMNDIIEIKKIAGKKIICKLKSKSKIIDNTRFCENDDEEVGEELDDQDDEKVFEEIAIRTKFYNPSDIVSYIKWLKIYDTLIMNYLINNPNEHIKTIKGALILPKDRGSFQALVPDSDKKDVNILNHVRMWKERYQDAIKLIQVAPNIIFTRSRR